jgi:molybdenum cofactor cytidylyltransferase
MIPPATAGIILAGGASSRMGRPKALLRIQGEGFLDRLIGLFSPLTSSTVVVLGYQAELIRASLKRSQEAVFTVNPEPERGMLSSLQCGLRAAPPDVDAILFTPVDYPAIRSSTIRALMDAYQRHRPPVALPVYGGNNGHPVCVSSQVAAELLALPPSAQARDVIRRYRGDTWLEPVNDPGILHDVDSPADYERLCAAFEGAAL